MSDLILRNVKAVYGWPHHGAPLSIWIHHGHIASIVPTDQLVRVMDPGTLSSATVIDGTGQIACPGFIDSHTHLLFAGSRESELYLRAGRVPYMEIMNQGGGIFSTVKSVRSASEEQLTRNGLHYLDKALCMGITTIEIKSGYGLDFQTEEKMLKVIQSLNDLHPVDIIPTFLVHSVPAEKDREAYLDEVIHRMIPAFRDYAQWFDIFLEKGVFTLEEGERLIEAAQDNGYHVGIHTNQINDIGGVGLAASMGVRHVDHLEILSDADAL